MSGPSRALLCVLAVALLQATGVAARTIVVRCGTVVEEEAVVDRDLRCDGPGLILRNPRSVLQLNGHTVESARSCAEGAAPSGIVVEKTAEGARILGPGLIRGFVTGIAIGEAARVTVRDVRVSDSCSVGILAIGTDGVRVRDGMLHRNGAASDEGGGVRVEQSARFALEGTEVFMNASGGKGAAVDLRDCDRCRIVANRILGNKGIGLRLDTESRAAILERNVVLDQRGSDVVDHSTDGTYILNVFEHGDGLKPPAVWPLPGPPAPAQPAPAGCGVMHGLVQPLATITLTCPQPAGIRAVRNSVVAYRMLDPFNGGASGIACNPVEILSATSSDGGGVRCTNPDRIYAALLETTCCLN